MEKVIMRAHPETGELGTEQTMKNGEKIVTVRVEQSTIEANNGFIQERKKVAFARLPENLKHLIDNKKDGDEFPIPGKIVVKEALKPFYEGQEPKRAGADGGYCVKDGQPIYREAIFTSNLNAQDELIEHNAIVESLAALETASKDSAEEL
jgi:hypothetical protein